MDKGLKRVVRSMDTIFVVAGIILFLICGFLVDRQFPVVIKTTILYAQSETAYTTLIGGTFVKVRDCDYDDVKFYKGERGDRAVTVQRDLLEKNKIRSTGEHEYGDWRVYANNIEVEREVYANVWHQCYIAPRIPWGKKANGEPKMWGIPIPWLTRSPFYK